MSSMPVADSALDVTGEICPMTYVRTRLALDRLLPGQILVVRLRGEEAARNVPLSAERHGHEVIARHTENGVLRLWLRRGGQPASGAAQTGSGSSLSRKVSASEPSA